LPTFKFQLEKSQGKVIVGSFGKEATVKQLPISKTIAGVSMKIEPGAMRELHWHATAAEGALHRRCGRGRRPSTLASLAKKRRIFVKPDSFCGTNCDGRKYTLGANCAQPNHGEE
jgi:hypothetical protein